MTGLLPSTIPDPPICRTADDSAHCPYAQHCVETRQRVQSGYRRLEGKWVLVGEPMWGDACWAFQRFREKKLPTPTEPIAASPPREPGDEPPF